VFGPDNEQETGCFEDAVVAVKSDVNGHHKDNATATTSSVILASRETPASSLFSDYPLFDPPPQSSGHFAHSSILFQPPPHPNLPIARKSRVFPVVNDATFSGNSNSNNTLPSITTQSYSSVVSDTSQPGVAQHDVNYSMAKMTTSNFAETSTLSTAPTPAAAWYDGNTFSCLECGYCSCSLGSYETHVRSQHGMEPSDFSAFTVMGSVMYRCECCMQQLYHEESTIRHNVHSHLKYPTPQKKKKSNVTISDHIGSGTFFKFGDSDQYRIHYYLIQIIQILLFLVTCDAEKSVKFSFKAQKLSEVPYPENTDNMEKSF
jgi:hypothetical protein